MQHADVGGGGDAHALAAAAVRCTPVAEGVQCHLLRAVAARGGAPGVHSRVQEEARGRELVDSGGSGVARIGAPLTWQAVELRIEAVSPAAALGGEAAALVRREGAAPAATPAPDVLVLNVYDAGAAPVCTLLPCAACAALPILWKLPSPSLPRACAALAIIVRVPPGCGSNVDEAVRTASEDARARAASLPASFHALLDAPHTLCLRLAVPLQQLPVVTAAIQAAAARSAPLPSFPVAGALPADALMDAHARTEEATADASDAPAAARALTTAGMPAPTTAPAPVPIASVLGSDFGARLAGVHLSTSVSMVAPTTLHAPHPDAAQPATDRIAPRTQERDEVELSVREGAHAVLPSNSAASPWKADVSPGAASQRIAYALHHVGVSSLPDAHASVAALPASSIPPAATSTLLESDVLPRNVVRLPLFTLSAPPAATSHSTLARINAELSSMPLLNAAASPSSRSALVLGDAHQQQTEAETAAAVAASRNYLSPESRAALGAIDFSLASLLPSHVLQAARNSRDVDVLTILPDTVSPQQQQQQQQQQRAAAARREHAASVSSAPLSPFTPPAPPRHAAWYADSLPLSPSRWTSSAKRTAFCLQELVQACDLLSKLSALELRAVFDVPLDRIAHDADAVSVAAAAHSVVPPASHDDALVDDGELHSAVTFVELAAQAVMETAAAQLQAQGTSAAATGESGSMHDVGSGEARVLPQPARMAAKTLGLAVLAACAADDEDDGTHLDAGIAAAIVTHLQRALYADDPSAPCTIRLSSSDAAQAQDAVPALPLVEDTHVVSLDAPPSPRQQWAAARHLSTRLFGSVPSSPRAGAGMPSADDASVASGELQQLEVYVQQPEQCDALDVAPVTAILANAQEVGTDEVAAVEQCREGAQERAHSPAPTHEALARSDEGSVRDSDVHVHAAPARVTDEDDGLSELLVRLATAGSGAHAALSPHLNSERAPLPENELMHEGGSCGALTPGGQPPVMQPPSAEGGPAAVVEEAASVESEEYTVPEADAAADVDAAVAAHAHTRVGVHEDACASAGAGAQREEEEEEDWQDRSAFSADDADDEYFVDEEEQQRGDTLLEDAVEDVMKDAVVSVHVGAPEDGEGEERGAAAETSNNRPALARVHATQSHESSEVEEDLDVLQHVWEADALRPAALLEDYFSPCTPDASLAMLPPTVLLPETAASAAARQYDDWLAQKYAAEAAHADLFATVADADIIASLTSGTPLPLASTSLPAHVPASVPETVPAVDAHASHSSTDAHVDAATTAQLPSPVPTGSSLAFTALRSPELVQLMSALEQMARASSTPAAQRRRRAAVGASASGSSPCEPATNPRTPHAGESASSPPSPRSAPASVHGTVKVETQAEMVSVRSPSALNVSEEAGASFVHMHDVSPAHPFAVFSARGALSPVLTDAELRSSFLGVAGEEVQALPAEPFTLTGASISPDTMARSGASPPLHPPPPQLLPAEESRVDLARTLLRPQSGASSGAHTPKSGGDGTATALHSPTASTTATASASSAAHDSNRISTPRARAAIRTRGDVASGVHVPAPAPAAAALAATPGALKSSRGKPTSTAGSNARAVQASVRTSALRSPPPPSSGVARVPRQKTASVVSATATNTATCLETPFHGESVLKAVSEREAMHQSSGHGGSVSTAAGTSATPRRRAAPSATHSAASVSRPAFDNRVRSPGASRMSATPPRVVAGVDRDDAALSGIAPAPAAEHLDMDVAEPVHSFQRSTSSSRARRATLSPAASRRARSHSRTHPHSARSSPAAPAAHVSFTPPQAGRARTPTPAPVHEAVDSDGGTDADTEAETLRRREAWALDTRAMRLLSPAASKWLAALGLEHVGPALASAAAKHGVACRAASDDYFTSGEEDVWAAGSVEVRHLVALPPSSARQLLVRNEWLAFSAGCATVATLSEGLSASHRKQHLTLVVQDPSQVPDAGVPTSVRASIRTAATLAFAGSNSSSSGSSSPPPPSAPVPAPAPTSAPTHGESMTIAAASQAWVTPPAPATRGASRDASPPHAAFSPVAEGVRSVSQALAAAAVTLRTPSSRALADTEPRASMHALHVHELQRARTAANGGELIAPLGEETHAGGRSEGALASMVPSTTTPARTAATPTVVAQAALQRAREAVHAADALQSGRGAADALPASPLDDTPTRTRASAPITQHVPSWCTHVADAEDACAQPTLNPERSAVDALPPLPVSPVSTVSGMSYPSRVERQRMVSNAEDDDDAWSEAHTVGDHSAMDLSSPTATGAEGALPARSPDDSPPADMAARAVGVQEAVPHAPRGHTVAASVPAASAVTAPSPAPSRIPRVQSRVAAVPSQPRAQGHTQASTAPITTAATASHRFGGGNPFTAAAAHPAAGPSVLWSASSGHAPASATAPLVTPPPAQQPSAGGDGVTSSPPPAASARFKPNLVKALHALRGRSPDVAVQAQLRSRISKRTQHMVATLREEGSESHAAAVRTPVQLTAPPPARGGAVVGSGAGLGGDTARLPRVPTAAGLASDLADWLVMNGLYHHGGSLFSAGIASLADVHHVSVAELKRLGFTGDELRAWMNATLRL